MKSDSATENVSPRFETYKQIIGGIDFMEKYMEDPKIFCPEFPKFNFFLIQAFSYIHSDFHYLSFLNSTNVDVEIVRAARILQILPTNDTLKLFENMHKSEIEKFWHKLFFLIKTKKNIESKGSYKFMLCWENKINFFKDISSTLNYLNYEFTGINVKKFNKSDVNKEITDWKDSIAKMEMHQKDSMIFDCSTEVVTGNSDLEKLNTNLNQVLVMYHIMKPEKKQVETDHLNFFAVFINLAKNFLEYEKNISKIDSIVLNNLNYKTLLTDATFSETLNFMKRCNNFVKTLKTKPSIF